MKKVTLYTDGACSGNPGIGGYGGILIYNDIRKEYNGWEKETTNNRMEIMAVIVGLKMLKYPCEVEIYSDSAYTVNAFVDGWLESWRENNWRKADNKEVLNVDLWQELYSLSNIHKISFNINYSVHNRRC